MNIFNFATVVRKVRFSVFDFPVFTMYFATTGWFSLLVFIFAAALHSAQSGNNNKGTTVSASCNCHNVYNGNTFSTRPYKEIKILLLKMKLQLADLQQKIGKLTGKQITGKAHKNCAELYKSGSKISGVYKIDPDGSGAFDVYCDQKTAGGGWTVFQKRLDGSVNFYRGWNDYKRGFGKLNGEFWLGLDKINRLTNSERFKLRVDLADTKGKAAYAVYRGFAVGNEKTKYKLSVGTYSGTAGDSLSTHRGSSFTTKDQDNDSYSKNCAVQFKGAWWYNSCHQSNLNGLYRQGKHSSYADGVNWYHWKGYYYSAKRAEMKIRPEKF